MKLHETGNLMKKNINTSSLNIRSQAVELFNLAFAVFLAMITLQIAGCVTVPNKQVGEVTAKEESIEEKWGIKIIGIRQTAAGYMLDFRYRVTDPEKALPLFARKIKPYIIEQSSGAKFAVPNPPKTGPLRTSDPPQAGRIYFIFFGNPGKYVKPGDKVTVVIGDFRAEDLVVE